MERRSFIRLAGLTTFGLMAGGNLVASALKMSNHQLIEIKPPNFKGTAASRFEQVTLPLS